MIVERLQALGSWNVKLTGAPASVVNRLDYLGHLVVTDGPVPADLLDDGILTSALYAGPLRRRRQTSDDTVELRGAGMALWLGDEDGKGDVLGDPGETFDADTFADTVRALIPDSLTEGTLHSVAGTYTGVHRLESRRTAMDYVTDSFGAGWRVNPDGSVDAGELGDLYGSIPATLIARQRRHAGPNGTARGIVGNLDTEESHEDYGTGVVLVGQVVAASGSTTVVSAVADSASGDVPYRDLQGNPVTIRRIVSEAVTTVGNADSRAQLALNRFSGVRRALDLDTDEYVVAGDTRVGELVHVYDPDLDLTDLANPVEWRGQTLHPVAIQLVGKDWPITPELGVAFRTGAGEWIDLTRWVQPDPGRTRVYVGALPRGLGSSVPTIAGRVADAEGATDTTIPGAVTLNTPWTTGAYLDTNGATRSYLDVAWLLPLNTDGSTITDGGHYQVRLAATGDTEATYQSVPWGTLTTRIRGLDPGQSYDVTVVAVDLYGNGGATSATETVVVSADTIAPATPAAPTVASSPLAVQVGHDLTAASGGPLADDTAYLEVHADAASGFAPDASSLLGTLAVGGLLRLGVDVVGTFPVPGADGAARWVKVRAVDHTGNVSNASAPASATADLIATVNIGDATITNAKVSDLSASKLTAGTITTETITLDGSATIQSADYDPGVAGYQIAGDGTIEANDATLRGSLIAGNVLIGGALDGVSIPAEPTATGGSGGLVPYVVGGVPQEFAFSWRDGSDDVAAAIGATTDAGNGPGVMSFQHPDGVWRFTDGTDVVVLTVGAGLDLDGAAITFDASTFTVAHAGSTLLEFDSSGLTDYLRVRNGIGIGSETGDAEVFLADQMTVLVDESSGTDLLQVRNTNTGSTTWAGIALVCGSTTVGQLRGYDNYTAIAALNNSVELLAQSGYKARIRIVSAASAFEVTHGGTTTFSVLLSGINSDMRSPLPALAGFGMTFAAGSAQFGVNTSQRAHKKAIRDLRPDGSVLTGVRPRQFTWRAKVLADGEQRANAEAAGFIVEEVAEVIPRAVNYLPDGAPGGLNELALIGYLWAEVQRLHELVEAR